MLNGTTAEIVERKALRINAAKTCQPIGAMYASLGIHSCMPHSHGSQGCCSYHRSHLTRHFKEPVIATTSSFTEGASVFGGLANLTQALKNIFTIYNPDVVAVHTTCLSEVIGDDIPTIVKRAIEEGVVPPGKVVIHANTPSFVGSHIVGFANMVSAIIRYLSEKSGEVKNQINIIPGFVEPADMREFRRLTTLMKVPAVILPDTSGVLDGGLDGSYEMFPRGGTTLPEIRSTGDSMATLGFGHFTGHPGALTLETKHNVPAQLFELPIGVSATDELIQSLRAFAPDGAVHPAIEEERARVIDAISDMQQYYHNKRVAVAGDPDHVISIVRFLLELGMKPVYVITGSLGNHFEKRLHELLDPVVPDAKIKQQADFFELHQWIKNAPVDLIVANTYGKYIARVEDIPLVRVGFPILDRVGHRFYPTVGYMGALRLIDQITNALFDKKDRDCAEEWFELVQ
ncbi:MAG: nitrogenase molybdenum-iron protein subunit beta [Puniceicoccales bacterium]|jgi:nitrogenase molybdenum-iron protein beta chain|nr:nitrogenase molybdenum-iron protein subunit beta [Puniceicoccales bacterium]